MRHFLIALGTVAALSSTPALLQAQLSLGPTLAINDGDIGIGATIGAPMEAVGEGIRFMGDFLYYFPDIGTYLEINANLTYDFPLDESTIVPFVLAGLNFGRSSREVAGVTLTNTDVGLNLGGGIVFDAGRFRPAVGGRFILRTGSPFVVFATLPFALGG